MSEPAKLSQLFTYDHINHIEIGEFPDEAAFHQFLKLLKEENKTFGLHSPLYRNQSKYDLLEKVQFHSEEAWIQFESEVELMSKFGAEYILVHFPYFKDKITDDVNLVIEDALKKLSILQEKFSIPIVCEPKLGHNRSTFGIEALHSFPIEIWDKYGINICIDIGDYLLAVEDETSSYIEKWKDHIKVVHLHNVEFQQNKYIWVPVHPSHETAPSYYNVGYLIKLLAKSSDVFFIFEHTPHSNPTRKFVEEGIRWVKSLI